MLYDYGVKNKKWRIQASEPAVAKAAIHTHINLKRKVHPIFIYDGDDIIEILYLINAAELDQMVGCNYKSFVNSFRDQIKKALNSIRILIP